MSSAYKYDNHILEWWFDYALSQGLYDLESKRENPTLPCEGSWNYCNFCARYTCQGERCEHCGAAWHESRNVL